MSNCTPQAYYAASAAASPQHLSLRGRKVCKVCVVGAGYTGLSAALHLAKAGIDVVVLEAETVGFAASGRNGGQIHTGWRKEQAYLEQWLGDEQARDLWAIAEGAKALVRALIEENAIACDLRNGLIIAAHNRRALADLQEDAWHLNTRYDFPIKMIDTNEIAAATGTDLYPGGTFDASGGHLHPLKFARGLAAAASAAGATLHEHTRVRAFEETSERVVVETSDGQVEAETLLLACDASSGSLVPSLASYIGHVESFIVATEPLADPSSILPSDAAVADTRHVLDYYRKSADGRLLFAGRESYFTPPQDVAHIVRPRMLRVFPSLADTRIEFAWSGTVGITYTRMPHFGRIGARTLFAHGYSGHGVALSVGGGKILAEAALGKTARFNALAQVPARRFPGGAWLRRPLIAAGLLWFKMLDAV